MQWFADGKPFAFELRCLKKILPNGTVDILNRRLLLAASNEFDREMWILCLNMNALKAIPRSLADCDETILETIHDYPSPENDRFSLGESKALHPYISEGVAPSPAFEKLDISFSRKLLGLARFLEFWRNCEVLLNALKGKKVDSRRKILDHYSSVECLGLKMHTASVFLTKRKGKPINLNQFVKFNISGLLPSPEEDVGNSGSGSDVNALVPQSNVADYFGQLLASDLAQATIHLLRLTCKATDIVIYASRRELGEET